MHVVRLDGSAGRSASAAAVTVGNFDGVHLGHAALCEAVVREARAASGEAAALTFDPHPSRVLAPERAPATLTTIAQRAELLAGLGVDRVAVVPFTRELSHVPAEEFARRLLSEALGARVVVVGFNFRFGSGRKGDVTALEVLGRTLGFRVVAVPPVVVDGAPVSSTRVREALARGAVEAAAGLLGRDYFVDGAVIRGVGRGRTLGIPTANLDPVNEILPGGGVYAARVRVPGEAQSVAAVVNVGRRPTFGGGATLVEAHLLDFEGDLYGRELRVAFAARLRDEQRFSGPDVLKKQIARDVAAARQLLRGPRGIGV
jgi:riboflavin kinase/FMN adenylyltransferase